MIALARRCAITRLDSAGDTLTGATSSADTRRLTCSGSPARQTSLLGRTDSAQACRSRAALPRDLGHRSGLFEALAEGPTTSPGLAQTKALSERHVREWLAAVTVGVVTTYDPSTQQYTLPPEHAMWLTGTAFTNLAPMGGMLTGLGQRIDDVADTFRTGNGVPYANYRPHFTCAMDAMGRAKYDSLLVSAYLPKVAGLVDALRAGSQVADVGCGYGPIALTLATRLPQATVVAVDVNERARALCRANAERHALTNVQVLDPQDVPADLQIDALYANPPGPGVVDLTK